MIVGFKVKYLWYSIGTGDFLNSFFSTIAYNLENNIWGSKYPIIMNELYSGKLSVNNLTIAENEFDLICKGLKALSNEYAVFDNYDLYNRELKNINTNSSDLSQFYLSKDGVELITVFKAAIRDAIELQSDLLISTLSDVKNIRDWKDNIGITDIKKKEGFIFKGTRDRIRSDEELKQVNKNEADEAFKNQKKKLDIFLEKRGFYKYKKNNYIRLNKLKALEFIELIKERYGSKTFTVNCALIPLIVHHEHITYGLSSRIGELICGSDIWWDFADSDIAKVSFDNIIYAIENYVLPWYEHLNNKDLLKSKLLEKDMDSLSNKQKEWLNALDANEDFDSLIKENIEKLKISTSILK